jgi:hypothetical protein
MSRVIATSAQGGIGYRFERWRLIALDLSLLSMLAGIYRVLQLGAPFVVFSS